MGMYQGEQFFDEHLEYWEDHDFAHRKLFYNIPRDEYELERVAKILNAQKEFNSKLLEIEERVKKLFEKLDPNNLSEWRDFKYRHEVTKNIWIVFAKELHNRPYLLDLRGYVQNPTDSNFIYARNIPCEICGENRTTDKCHIIPARFGGQLNDENVVCLCPTHHRLFDRGKLTEQEIARIDFSLKSKWSYAYFEVANLPRHKEFQKSIKDKDYGITTTEDDFRKFIDIVFLEVKKRYEKHKERKECLEVFCESSYPIARRCFKCIENGQTVRDVIV